jgi:hypothetical protein
LKRGNEKCFIGPVFKTKDDGRVISRHVVRIGGNGEGFPYQVVRRGGDEKGFIDNVVRKRSQQYFSEQVGR